MEEQVVVLYAGTNGFVDDYPVAVLGRYEKELLSFMHSRKKDIIETIRSTGKLDEGVEKSLREALTDFAKTFSVKDPDEK